jgi:hypothetical protein
MAITSSQTTSLCHLELSDGFGIDKTLSADTIRAGPVMVPRSKARLLVFHLCGYGTFIRQAGLILGYESGRSTTS